MNNKVIIAVVTAVIIIGGGVALYMANSSNMQQNETKKTETAQTTTKTSLSELLEKGDPQKCTYSGSNEGYEYSGTAYFSSEKQLRNDYKSERDNESRDGSMIISDGSQYFWNNDDKKGFKTAVLADDTQQTDSQSSDSVDTKAKFSFECEQWTIDNSKFTPPSDVTFQDLTQIMQNIPTSGQ